MPAIDFDFSNSNYYVLWCRSTMTANVKHWRRGGIQCCVRLVTNAGLVCEHEAKQNYLELAHPIAKAEQSKAAEV